jgi:hypothetical protein
MVGGEKKYTVLLALIRTRKQLYVRPQLARYACLGELDLNVECAVGNIAEFKVDRPFKKCELAESDKSVLS